MWDACRPLVGTMQLADRRRLGGSRREKSAGAIRTSAFDSPFSPNSEAGRRKPRVERATCPSRRATSPPIPGRHCGDKMCRAATANNCVARRASSPPAPAGSRCHPFPLPSSGSVNLFRCGKCAPPPRLDDVSRRDGGGPTAWFRLSPGYHMANFQREDSGASVRQVPAAAQYQIR